MQPIQEARRLWSAGSAQPPLSSSLVLSRRCFLPALLALLCATATALTATNSNPLKLPVPGDHALNILSPTLLELVRINAKPPYPARVDSWDWVTDQGNFAPPSLSSLQVTVDGVNNPITGVGFKRRPTYAPPNTWDLRVGNYFYLQLSQAIAEGQTVRVVNDGTLWPTNWEFAAAADPLRFNPALHVNQEGYLPAGPKKALVGYYLGNLGEMPIPTHSFSVVNASGTPAFQSTLTWRPDVGFPLQPLPYQAVYEADFSSLTTPGEYRLVVPGLGASLPFRIEEGIAMDFARTYALGLFHQRSGYNVAMPFTRFTHAADHLAPASVPVDTSAPFAFTWQTIANYASQVNSDNPPQTAPLLTSPAAQLYPYVNPGPVEVAGGHFEAGNYTKVTWNAAQVIHILLFAVDSLPGVAALDNLGLPESGDGISDLLQEAKWEADFLAKMQDADGGFYYMTYPQYREYEYDVLPENGDPQVVWPKNTSTTAAAVAALAQAASSPSMKQAYPQAASNYWARAQLGWSFLTNALARYGQAGAYQKIMHFDDTFTHNDELAWAACELFLATGNPQFRAQLEAWLPDPTDPATLRWGWLRQFACYGNVTRDYAMAVRSGRLQASQFNPTYLDRCQTAIIYCGYDKLTWSQHTAYGTSLPDQTKQALDVGWYFSSLQAFDLVVAQQLQPDSAYVDAILRNLNYDIGCNPLNLSFLPGLGWERPRVLVDQYSNNDRHALPKIGMPIGNIQGGFIWTTYGGDLDAMCFPSDDAPTAPYAFYDRFCDFFNVTAEASTDNVVRSLAAAAWVAAQTSLANQPWRWTNATLTAPGPASPGQPVTVILQVANPNLTGAKIIWEALDQEPTFGGLAYTLTPPQFGNNWVEAEVQWPDGRRAFATNVVIVTGPARLADPRSSTDGTFSFLLTGTPRATYIVQTSADLDAWTPAVTNTLPDSGVLSVTAPGGPLFPSRYYRAVVAP